MCKFELSEDQKMPSRSLTMDNEILVREAKATVKKLVATESRGHGDQANAMNRLEARYGLPYWTLWSLLYRSPKDVSAAFLLRLQSAYSIQCEKQKALYEHEAKITKEIAGSRSFLVRAAAALAGENDSEEVK